MRHWKAFVAMTLAFACLPLQGFAQSWHPSDQQKTTAVSLANAFFAAMDSQRYGEARSLMTPGMQNRIDLPALQRLKTDQRAQYGAVVERRIASVSWYPKGSQEGTGVAAAVDFQARTDGGAFLCGYLSIIERTSGQFEVLRHDSTGFLPEDAQKMTNAKLLELLDRPGCRVFLKQ